MANGSRGRAPPHLVTIGRPFAAVKSLDTFDFLGLPTLNKMLVLELARSEYVIRHENIIALGPSGTGKTHVGLGLGLAACQKGFSVFFTTTATLVNRLMEARDSRQLSRLQAQLASVKLPLCCICSRQLVAHS